MTMTNALGASAIQAAKSAKGRSARGGRAVGMAGFKPLIPLLTAVGVMILLVVGIEFGRTAGMVTALWGAGGLAAGMWLRSGSGRLHDLCFGALILVGIVAGEVIVSNTPQAVALFTVANMVEIVAAVLLVRRFAPPHPTQSVRGTLILLLLVGVLAPLPSAFIAMASASATGGDVAEAFQTWWFGHALGFATIVPAILAADRRLLNSLRSWKRVAEWVGLFTVLGFGLWYAYSLSAERVSFFMLPLLMIIAARLRIVGAGIGLVMVAIFSIGATIAEGGDRLAHTTLMLQLNLLFSLLPFTLLAALLNERDALGEKALLAQRRAERASQAKSRLLANVSHEIKSPIGGVIGIAEMWRDGRLGPVDAAQAEMSDMLVRTARQIEILARDLLDVSRAEAGAVSVDIRPVDVGGLLDDIRRSSSLWPEARGVRLEIVPSKERLVALADSVRLTQVMTNLASNAFKYGASGGVVILSADRVGEDWIRLTVRDHGPGLTEAKQAELFEPFNRLGMERSTVEGHGIGLALAKRLVEMQDGRIGVDSAAGDGAAFWVELKTA